MKEIIIYGKKLFKVISEPGDATRYSYFVFCDYDDYCFMPCQNTFRYPQQLNYYAVKDLNEEEEIEIATKGYCNVFTLRECIRTIKELEASKKKVVD